LLLVICSLLFVQYQGFSEKLEAGEGGFKYTQEIEITYRSGSLDIRQHFHSLSNQTIEITWPNLAVSADCFLDSETSCERLSEDKTKFKAAEGLNASLSYIIPLDGGLKSNQLLKEIFVTLENGEASYTTVHIATDSEVKGQWITGLPLKGEQKLSLVNYSMFGGTGSISEIFWQSGELNVKKVKDSLSIYSQEALNPELVQQISNLKFLNEDHIAIVQGKNRSAVQGKRILFVDNISMASIGEQVLLSQVNNQYDLEGSPSWISEVMASFLTNSTIGSNKSTAIVQNLSDKLSDSEKLHWVNKLKDLKGEEITAEKLDETLSAVFERSTEYFEMNAKTDQVYPFLFTDEREVYVNSELNPEVKVIFKDGEVLYAIDPLLKGLGYQTSIGENGYYVQNETQNFRFPQNYGFYVSNNQRYNTASEPLTIIAGNYYMEETWIQRVFNVNIEKTESAITIK